MGPAYFYPRMWCGHPIMEWKKYGALQHFSCRSTTVGTLHATSLQSFGYGDIVHQFEKRCKAKGNKEQELELFFNNSSDFKNNFRQDLRKKTGFYSKSLFLTHKYLR